MSENSQLDLVAAFYKQYPVPIHMTDRRKVLLQKVKDLVKGLMRFKSARKNAIIAMLPFFTDANLEEMYQVFQRQALRELIFNRHEASESTQGGE